MLFVVPPDSFLVLVTGDREWSNRDEIWRAFQSLPSNTVIIHGAARGADLLADSIATEFGFLALPNPAHWKHNDPAWVVVHGPCAPNCPEIVGRAAGVLRNKFMLDTYNPDLLLAFHKNLSGSRGTKDMVRRGVKAQKKVILYNGQTDPEELDWETFKRKYA
jgi:hypothetical protein